MHRRAEAVCDRIMGMCGADEPLIEPAADEQAVIRATRQWRKPLSIAEVAQLAPTEDVRARRGRP